MTHLVFVHGWGFDPTFWEPLSQLLTGFDKDYADLGFFGENSTFDIPKDAVYITHSMGLAWATRFAKKPRAIIAINGFTQFCTTEDWPHGVGPRVLSRMIRQFERSPREVWTEFMKNSGLENPTLKDNADMTALLNGLKELQTFDIRGTFAAIQAPKLVISSTGDQIVPEKLTTASFGEDVIWYKGGNHLLPLCEPQSLAEHIRRFLDRC